VNKAIDKLIDKIVEKGKAFLNKSGQMTQSAIATISRLFGIKAKFKTKNGESHSVYYENKGGEPVLTVASSPKPIIAFLDFYENKYKVDKNEATQIRIFVTKQVNPLIQQLKQAKNKNDTKKANSIEQQLLDKNVELSGKLSKLIDSNTTVGKVPEIYLLEGVTGTYGSIPKPKGDSLTADHQPQAAILEWAARQPFFSPTSNMAKRAKGRAKEGYAINLHENRHKAGRTYGNNGKATKESFIKKAENKLRGLSTDKEKRKITVNLIKEDLVEDVKAMKKVANKPSQDAVWADINALTISVAEKNKLANDIRSRIIKGEDQLLNQDIDSLKN
jgi:hypothetical protein